MFQVQLPMLLRPRCAALYSYPLEVDHDPHFESLKRGQTNRYVLGNVKLIAGPDNPDILPDGRRVMNEFVETRIPRLKHDVFEVSDKEWDRVLHYSAGNFRELSRLLCHALEIAAMEQRPRVTSDCFNAALTLLRADYNPFVQRHRGFLRDVQDSRKLAPQQLNPDLLSPLLAAFAVVEYPNNPGWLGLNPIVADLLNDRPSTV